MNTEITSLFERATGVSTDSRTLQQGELFFALSGPSFNGNQFAASALKAGAIGAIIDDPAFEQEGAVLVPNVMEALQDLARWQRLNWEVPVIGITGSNGKTTTKELIAAVLQTTYKTHFTQGNLNNHIGVPLTILNAPKDMEIAIIEMGANHPGEIAFLSEIAQPRYGLITNIGKAHLEGFGGFEGVIKTKTELYRHLEDILGHIFIHSDDSLLMSHLPKVPHMDYGSKSDAHVQYEVCTGGATCEVNINGHHIQSNLVGAYNASNLAAAWCIGEFFEVEESKMVEALSNYNPSNNRSQVVKTSHNTVILDAYNANPSSVEAAIREFQQAKHPNGLLILGDMFELGPYEAEEHQRMVDLVGKESQAIWVGKAFKACKHHEGQLSFESTEELMKYLEEHPVQDHTVLIKGSRGMALERIQHLL